MIDAKPTWYKSTRFRSRTEARVGIFLDMVGAIWEYEPYVFTIETKGWSYTPDMLIKTSKTHCYLEVKPAAPSDQYLEWLTNFKLDLPLVFVIGSFYKHTYPTLRLFDIRRGRPQLLPVDYSSLFDNHRTAIITATKYRFDLRS